MKYDVQRIRAEFPSLSVTDQGTPRVYFDNPGGTQVAKRVMTRMMDYFTTMNTNHGGAFITSRRSDALLDEAHQAMADLVGATDPGEIVFGQNMTTLTLHISRSIGLTLKPGDEIVVTRMDHDANVSPWLLMARDHGLTVKWLDFSPETYQYDLSSLESVLSTKTKLVAVNYASNATGTVNDVQTITKMAHAVGALVYVDAVQLTPHFVTDVREIGCDFLACSAYKFYGPHQGLLWGRRSLLETLKPYKVRPADDAIPHAWETGTQSHEGMAGTLGAIEHMEWIGTEMGGGGASRRERIVSGFNAVATYERTLCARLISGLLNIQGVTVHGLTRDVDLSKRVPTVAITRKGVHPNKMAESLGNANIFVWDGNYYAIEVIERLGLTDKGGMLRIGLGQYNTADEVDAILNHLERKSVY
ncbi:MAG: cysteine desulfurase-like protein [Bacteroidetes bacterium]|nr:cysteine desulfurase-like protein [Bacteroidota bacterium]